MTPTQTLSLLLRRLRNRFLARKAIEILAIALAADLSMNALSLGSFLLFGTPLRTQFFLEALLSILLVQAALRSREGAFALFLDGSFGLKDRFYSHLQYRKDPSVPEMLREAQAMECLRSLDAAALARRVGPRFPPSFLLTLPLFVGLTFYYMNVPYRPPSTLGRAVVDILSPRHGASSLLPFDPTTASGDLPSDKGTSAVEAIAMDTEAAGPEAPPAVPSRTGADASDGKGVAGPERREDSDVPAAGPERIQSFPVTEEVSPVAPPVLANSPSGLEADGYDPRRLLGLIPWPEADLTAQELTQMARDVPTPNLESYPVTYRSHIDRYFQELLAWQTR